MPVYDVLKKTGAGICLAVITLLVAELGGCRITPDGISILSTDYLLPEYQSYQVLDSYTILLQFNGDVTLSEVHVSSIDDDGSAFSVPAVCEQQKSEVPGGTLLTVDTKLEKGQQYVLYAVAEDTKGNSLHFSTVLQGYNENPAKVVLSEVRTTYSNPKCEFVELYALDGGSLAGMVLEITYGQNTLNYMLPDIEVEKGEYVVVHLRKVSETCIDETGDNLEECSHKDASPGRDIWRNETTKAIGTTGTILLWNRAHGNVVDALLFAESTKESWPGNAMGIAAQKAEAAGIWQNGPGIDGAVCSDGMTVTRTLSRQGIEELGNEYPVAVWGDEWFVVGTSQGTPGTANSAIAYQ